MSTRRRFLIGIACALVAAAGIVGAWRWHARPLAATIVSPSYGPAVELVYATGAVEPAQPVAVAARLTAPVTEVRVDEGDVVRKGAILLRLDDADLRSELAKTLAQSMGASLAERRITALFAQGWLTRAARDAAVADGAAARAAAQAAGDRLAQSIIRAGIDGIVTRRDIQPGELATPGRVLMTIGDPRRIRISATVDERDINHVRAGQLAWLSSAAWPGRRLSARVASLTPTGDPSQRAFRVYLVVDPGLALPLGMTFEVNIVTRKTDHAMLIPASALDDRHVWLSQGGRARRRAVRLGMVGAEHVEILSGLGATDLVIDRPPPGLEDGMRVRAAR